MASPTIACKQCGHVNEGERIYCHNCGLKLDRSLIPATPEPGPKAKKEAQDRVRRMTNPPTATVKNLIAAFCKTVFCAVVAAAFCQMFRTPIGAPALSTDAMAEPPQIGMILEEAEQSTQPRTLTATTAEINAYLLSMIRSPKNADGYVKFVRLYVELTPGVCHLHLQDTVFGYAIYFGTDYQLAIVGDKVDAKNVGGSIGRLPVHPLLTKYSHVLFAKPWQALKTEHKQIDGLQSITVRKDAIEMVTRPAAAG